MHQEQKHKRKKEKVVRKLTEMVHSRGSQPWQYWRLGPADPLWWRAVLCIVACFAMSPASYPLDTTGSTSHPSCDNQKHFQTLPNASWGADQPKSRTTALWHCSPLRPLEKYSPHLHLIAGKVSKIPALRGNWKRNI